MKKGTLEKLTLLLILIVCASSFIQAQSKLIYKFDIKREIDPAAWRQTQAAFDNAEEQKADYILIHMNTYGGMVDMADKICTKILDSKIPVIVFIDKNAASAGALISIACDSIYMAPGASIGAATVVDQAGTPQPEKYQSYMRSKLRATAEVNKRDPRIAEAMNDPRIKIENVNDSGKVLTFTTEEAIKNGYCEGEVKNIDDVIARLGITNSEIKEYKPSTIEAIVDFLLSPAVSGILIMVIIGGIYFELQAPGIGFPLFAAIGAAVLYFAPLYLEGLAANWEIALFVLGVVLVVVELFAIPGFGVIGISGIVCIVLGLTLSLVGAMPTIDAPVDLPPFEGFVKSLFVVVLSIVLSVGVSMYLGPKLMDTKLFGKFVLQTTQASNKGYVSADIDTSFLIGKSGLAFTVLRPSGKVEIESEVYDAIAMNGYIEKGDKVEVVKTESAQVLVRKSL
ncbi:MAG: S49 family peptidase [Bacteroidetes bacterium]|nr:S49 family peptidase [Bacteroidota bacterium]